MLNQQKEDDLFELTKSPIKRKKTLKQAAPTQQQALPDVAKRLGVNTSQMIDCLYDEN